MPHQNTKATIKYPGGLMVKPPPRTRGKGLGTLVPILGFSISAIM